MIRSRLPALVAIFAWACASVSANAQDEAPKFLFDTGDTEWRGERIALPPGFAPDMKWVGEEDIRFAPGMFTAEADDFFTYVLVFVLDKEADVTEKDVEAELLTYYRGLASLVMKGKKKEVDTEPFTVELSKADAATSAPEKTADVTQYNGTLDWIEPFATQEKQQLHIEAQVWKHGDRPALFLCVSPKNREDDIWKKLREIRAAFGIE